jgi:hypothetical protein
MTDYIDNKKFELLVSSYIYNRTSEVEQQLVDDLNKLIDNIFLSFNFKLDHEDAKQDCFYLIFKVMRNFKPENGSAFNYFTTVIVNNLRLIYTKNKIYNNKLEEYIKLRSLDKELLEP